MRQQRSVVAVAVLCLGALAGCAGSSPSATIKAFYNAVGKGETEEAMGLVSQQTVSMIGKEKLRAGLQEATRKMLAKGGLQGIEIADEKVAGDVAMVTALLKYGNGTQEREVNDLAKENGAWRLRPKK